MSNAWGKALDQASIVKASFNDLERTCIKATRHKMRVPKEKHVRKLVIYTHERLGPIGDLYLNLLKRLEQPDWIIVLKGLIVFHRVFGSGNIRFLEDLSHRGVVFPLNRFTDMASTQAHQQSVFIRKYSSYLEEKIFTYREMKCEFDKESYSSKGLSIDQLLYRIPKMQRQFDALLATHVEEVCDNIITINAFELLLKDSFKMYCNLNDAVLNVLVFMRETNDIIHFFDSSRRKFHIDLPQLSPAPSTVVKGLEEYLRDLEDDDGRPNNHNNNNNSNRKNSLGSQFRANNQLEQQKKMMDDASLINFDDDLFSSAPTPTMYSNQTQPSFHQQHQQYQQQQQTQQQQQQQQSLAKKPSQSFDPLDPFAITTNQPLSPMMAQPQQQQQQQYQQQQQQLGNGVRSTGTPLTSSMSSQQNYNPFNEPAYNEKALQIKAAFESSSSSNSAPLVPINSNNNNSMNSLKTSQPIMPMNQMSPMTLNNNNFNQMNQMNQMNQNNFNNNNNFNQMNKMPMQPINNNGFGQQQQQPQPMNNGGFNNNQMKMNSGGGFQSQPMMGQPMGMNGSPMNNGGFNNNNNNNGVLQPQMNQMNRPPMMNNGMMQPNMGMQMNSPMGMQPMMGQPNMGMQQQGGNMMMMQQPGMGGMGMNNYQQQQQQQQKTQQVQNIYF
ncbi:ANTH domain-containing protein [Heterostelium album PN500]|uniref:ANTH domain-containing protein n=1 Tax=Heterostelium pallidum (strain ATCC 26659 / Pp 5 / PN500) TaxID=670386 RepID=D3BNV6_HETP5|nr:ANTH domain-containing protein [Heterostelium album PN500]EFA76875.1 ANTH domain-containing protein [Heterostelium album PN500]|eukprot:XP_020429007.1 ANTH domain-containing protein [Heterostelium album PN500]